MLNLSYFISYQVRFYFLILFCAFNLSIYCETQTIRLGPDGTQINLYVETPHHIVYSKSHLVSEQHEELIETLRGIEDRDPPHTNHCFIQLFSVIEHPGQAAPSIIHGNISWDFVNNCITLSLINDPSVLVNFVSRNNYDGTFTFRDINAIYLTPSSCSSLELEHSEFIFLHHFARKQDLFQTLLHIHNVPKESKVVSNGIIFYSLLDSCDPCQKKILDYICSTDLDVQTHAIFYSVYPCKKSSYTNLVDDTQQALIYDKYERRFYTLIDNVKSDGSFCPTSIVYDMNQLKEKKMLISHIENK